LERFINLKDYKPKVFLTKKRHVYLSKAKGEVFDTCKVLPENQNEDPTKNLKKLMTFWVNVESNNKQMFSIHHKKMELQNERIQLS
jgi:hypothetical protein